jgi:outer membrane lipoprotein-sorting protein
MNCHECIEQLVPYVEGLLDGAAVQAVEAHLADCPACRAEAAATRELHDRLVAAGNVPVDTSLDRHVMDQIFRQQVTLTKRLTMRRRIRMFGGSGIAALLLIGLTWVALQHGPSPASAADILARGAQAAADLKSVYIKCRMRTQPADNFSGIDLQSPFVDVELWEQYSPLKWKIAKPGRVAAMDGHQTVMLIHNRLGMKVDVAAPEAFDTGWLHRLAAVNEMLSSELEAVKSAGYEVKVIHEDEAAHQVTVEVDPKETVGDYLKNKFLDTASTRRVYSFDPQTGRLEGAKFYCRTDDKEVLVLEIVKIEYNPVFNDSVFQLDIPKNVVWWHEPEVLPDNEKYAKMTPEEAARAFFEACANKDWEEVQKIWGFPLTDDLKKYLGGLELIKLGKPFQAKPSQSWFVPYEIRLGDGQVRKWNLALRKDNPAHRWQFDGGL